jgi:uncharacterized protein (UPF0332 family)
VSLADWASHGWLKPHEASASEIGAILDAAARDLDDARKDISPPWRFAIAYNAALRLGSAALLAAGYRSAREQKHYRTFAALPLILGPSVEEATDFFDRCRVRRHEITYEALDNVSASEADAIIAATERLERLVRDWLRGR